MKLILPWLCAAFLGAETLSIGGLQGAVESVLETTGDFLTSDDFSKIQFILYTNSSNNSYLVAEASDLVVDPCFDASKPTALFIHGYTGSKDSDSVREICRAFLQRDSHNFVALDWSPYVTRPYIKAYLRVAAAAEVVGSAVNLMVEAGLSPDGFWPIGHSLGAQLAGLMSKHLHFNLTRITGLDPALPGFGPSVKPDLSRDDAAMVDVIHSDAGVLGAASNDGTIDLWPNGGHRPQPGCEISEAGLVDALLTCSHGKSWQFFAESIADEFAFPAVRCSSWSAFQKGSCPPNETNIVYMGYASPATHLKGTFYLRTGSEEPYGLGMDGTVPANDA